MRSIIRTTSPRGNEKGDSHLLCEAPVGPFRQKVAVTFFARRALTLIEVVASTLIVGLMAVLALGALGAAVRSGQSAGDRAIGQSLASDLVAEIIATAYEDPDDDPDFGPEGAEGAGPRSGFDDVDDYDGWSSQPPKYRDGTTLPDREDWRRTVTVQFVQPNSPNLPTVGSTDLGAKRITVTVQHHDQDIAEQSVIRTDTE